jgi:hypothetical protein
MTWGNKQTGPAPDGLRDVCVKTGQELVQGKASANWREAGGDTARENEHTLRVIAAGIAKCF